jgi:predicted Rossmann-fold nucleotide-binding protein
MMVWQLIQVHHIDRSIPLIFAGKMWPGLVEWARKEMLSFDPPLANPDDMNIPICVDTAEEAAEVIRNYRDRWLAENKE